MFVTITSFKCAIYLWKRIMSVFLNDRTLWLHLFSLIFSTKLFYPVRILISKSEIWDLLIDKNQYILNICIKVNTMLGFFCNNSLLRYVRLVRNQCCCGYILEKTKNKFGQKLSFFKNISYFTHFKSRGLWTTVLNSATIPNQTSITVS